MSEQTTHNQQQSLMEYRDRDTENVLKQKNGKKIIFGADYHQNQIFFMVRMYCHTQEQILEQRGWVDRSGGWF